MAHFIIFTCLAVLFTTASADHHRLEDNGHSLVLLNGPGHDLKITFNGPSITRTETSPNLGSGHWIFHLSDGSTVEMTVRDIGHPGTLEWDFSWLGTGPQKDQELCLHLGDPRAVHWYSTYESPRPSWPLNSAKAIDQQAFNYLHEPSPKRQFTELLEQIFVNSHGFTFHTSGYLPLFYRLDPNPASDPKLCFTSKNSAPYWSTSPNGGPAFLLNFYVLGSANPGKAITDLIAHSSWSEVNYLPDIHLFDFPLFRTDSFDDLEFLATNLESHGYRTHSILVVSLPNWQILLEDQELTKSYAAKVAHVKSRGFQVQIQAIPVIHGGFPKPEFQVHGADGKPTNSKLLDMSNAPARAWFGAQLGELKKRLGADSTQLGPYNYPDHIQLFDVAAREYPSLLTTLTLGDLNWMSHTTHTYEAYKTQRLPIFVHLSTPEGGSLKAIIANVLSLSIGGYSWITGPEIGGSSPENSELFLRTLQATALLPSISFAPSSRWLFNSPISGAIAHLVQIHRDFQALHVDLAHKRIAEGLPIIRPLWMEFPGNEESYTVEDEYLVGPGTLVAPVVVLGTTERSVWFPPGTWVDQRNHQEHRGPGWQNVQVPLTELAYFNKIR